MENNNELALITPETQPKRACCKHCKQSFAYSTGSKVGGSEPRKWRYRSLGSAFIPFDQDRCRHEIARMVNMHRVEHPGFIAFVRKASSYFEQHGQRCAWCRAQIVIKICDSVKYVKTSESHDEMLVQVTK
ncbi:hypothetical protein GQ457_10G003960 [Hibiscus cannabinus]